MNYLWRLAGMVAYFLLLPFLYVYLRFGTRARVLIVAEDSVLLVKGWLGSDTWSLPGGGLHNGETEVDGAIREVKEETGIQLQPADLTKTHNGIFRRHGLQYAYALFCVQLPKKPNLIKQQFELTDIAWIPIKEVAPQRCDPVVTEAVNAWRKA
jgi:8-oxo-dGTP pyrophosphatase MutT (NUDIX family)